MYFLHCFILIERATVKAKQYIRTNVTSIRDECQGVELQFLCRDSSPSSSTALFHENSTEKEMDAFRGFNSTEKDRAEAIHQAFFEKTNEQYSKTIASLDDQKSDIILANVFISNACTRSGNF